MSEIFHACYDEETLHAYALGLLSAEQAAALEVHMDTCADCSTAVWKALDDALEERGWGPEVYARACRGERLSARLAAAASAAAGELKAALEGWAARGAACAGGAVRALRPGGDIQWQTSPVGLAIGLGGTGAYAVRGLDRATRLRRGRLPAPSSSIEVGLSNGSRALVSVEGGAVVVRFPGRSQENPPPPTLLIPDEEHESPQSVLANWDKFAGMWAAAMALPAGEFEVVIGPVSDEA